MKKPELMSPVKNLASLEACKNYADAVYFSVDNLSMRAGLQDINLKNLGSFVNKCHSYKIKNYLVVNSVLYNSDLVQAEKIIKKSKQVKVDAVIVWDPAAIVLAKKYKVPFIISTQANISNYQSALFYKKLGARRVVLAREMNLKQIKELKKKVGKLEVETFIHGAMCYSISGRCLLSAYLYNKSANCGACAQPCRKQWVLSDTEGHKIVNEGKYFLSAKDLCMIKYVPELIRAGVDSFKIEGRKRDPRYIEITARCYREAIDSYFANTFTQQKVEHWQMELTEVYNRGFSTGFYFGDPGYEGISYDEVNNLSPSKKILLGEVKKYYPKLRVAEINFSHQGLEQGEEIVIENSDNYFSQTASSIQIDSNEVLVVKKGQLAGMLVYKSVKKGDKIYKLVSRY